MCPVPQKLPGLPAGSEMMKSCPAWRSQFARRTVQDGLQHDAFVPCVAGVQPGAGARTRHRDDLHLSRGHANSRAARQCAGNRAPAPAMPRILCFARYWRVGGNSISRRSSAPDVDGQFRALRHGHSLVGTARLPPLEPRLVLPPQASRLSAPDIVGNQACNHQGRPVQSRELLGSQDYLVQAVTADAAIQDTAATQPLQLCWQDVQVADLLALSEGIGDSRYGTVGRCRLLAGEIEDHRRRW